MEINKKTKLGNKDTYIKTNKQTNTNNYNVIQLSTNTPARRQYNVLPASQSYNNFIVAIQCIACSRSVILRVVIQASSFH